MKRRTCCLRELARITQSGILRGIVKLSIKKKAIPLSFASKY
jgi:hypothetical protein